VTLLLLILSGFLVMTLTTIGVGIALALATEPPAGFRWFVNTIFSGVGIV
jgi:hypothetical protein